MNRPKTSPKPAPSPSVREHPPVDVVRGGKPPDPMVVKLKPAGPLTYTVPNGADVWPGLR